MKREFTCEDYHVRLVDDVGNDLTIEVPEQFRGQRLAVLLVPAPEAEEGVSYKGMGIWREGAEGGWRNYLYEDIDLPDFVPERGDFGEPDYRRIEEYLRSHKSASKEELTP